MQSSGWITLLRLVPPAYQENLAITTQNGAEIAIHRIVRIEEEYMVVRGRVMGTTDGGSFFVVPFDRINHIGFPRPLKEHQIRGMFGEVCDPSAGEKATASADGSPSEETSPSAAATEDGNRAGPDSGLHKPTTVEKSNLLERLRARRSASEFSRPAKP
jgi:hypothetical protein